MKRIFIISMGIGFLISSVFIAMPSMMDGTSDWFMLQVPGISAAYLFWGAVGSSVFVGVAISWFVNAVV